MKNQLKKNFSFFLLISTSSALFGEAQFYNKSFARFQKRFNRMNATKSAVIYTVSISTSLV